MADKPKSNRYIDDAEEIFKSDLNVPETMKKYVTKKLSEMIQKQVEFVDITSKSKKSSKTKERSEDFVQLLTNAPPIDINKDPLPDIANYPTQPLEIKRRKITSEPIELSESEKIKSASISSDIILNHSDTTFWKSRRKSKHFEYKVKNGIGYFREPITEWTKLRNKNNWIETKIKNFKQSKPTNRRN